MKTLLYLMIALFMSANITSCTPTALTDSTQHSQAQAQDTGGEDGEVEEEEDDGSGN